VVTLVAQARAEPTPQRYQIRSAVGWARQSAPRFPAFQAQVEGGGTVLSGILADQARYGVPAEAEALGLELIEVRRLRR
jgi:hypothetical protein